jgi:hypothetical protein
MLVVDGLNSEPLSPDFALPAGAKLFEFAIESLLAYTGFGITYRATDTLLREAVAIKEYLPNEWAVRLPEAVVRAKSDEKQEEFRTGLEAFREEARVLALFRDGHIVRVRRYFEMNGTGYIVLDLEHGQTLSDLIEDFPLHETKFRDVFFDILDGIEVIHNRDILHNNLKPSNIILRYNGSVVIVDFEAARHVKSRYITTAGSPYSPPEHYGAGGQQGPWSDLYTLGAIAYHCATGSPPPDSPRRLRNDHYVPAVIAAPRTFDKAFLSAIDWMLKVEKADRPQSVAQLRLALSTGIVPPSLPDEASGLEQALEQVVTAEFSDRRFARKVRARPLAPLALLLSGTIALSASGVAFLKAESISEIACGRFGMLCTSWQTALLKASACFAETDVCNTSSCTAAFRSSFPAHVLPVRLATLESAARETCRRAPEDALNAAKRCAARFAGSPAAGCEIVGCYEDYLIRFPDGRSAGDVKETLRQANSACLEPRLFNQAVACSIATPCKAVACFSSYRAVYPDSMLRPQSDLAIARAAGLCTSPELESAAGQSAARLNPGRAP